MLVLPPRLDSKAIFRPSGEYDRFPLEARSFSGVPLDRDVQGRGSLQVSMTDVVFCTYTIRCPRMDAATALSPTPTTGWGAPPASGTPASLQAAPALPEEKTISAPSGVQLKFPTNWYCSEVSRRASPPPTGWIQTSRLPKTRVPDRTKARRRPSGETCG